MCYRSVAVIFVCAVVVFVMCVCRFCCVLWLFNLFCVCCVRVLCCLLFV